MATGIPFPDIDPIALALGPLQIRWYGLAYLAGFLGGWYYSSKLAAQNPDTRPNREDIDNILPFLVLGVILGGRLGYVLFYNLGFYLQNPLDVIKIWQGGMSFHGGLLG
ncbi:MAG: prolipoprotein diacylglyceryl transferase, partial [Alphaproteobacteria bacterium]|nr:prolipoprotein diacylglyceryl transferase [Alphaproteobacteria bacterium]